MADVLTIIFIIIAVVIATGIILVIFEIIIFVVVMSGHAIQDKITEIKHRHETRFVWYYKMGLCESSWLIEPRIAKNYCWAFTPWAK